MGTCNPLAEDALAIAVDSVGTLQQVGHRLRPELSPPDAGRWLAHCLDTTRRERLSYAQQRLVFAWACEAGQHEGFRAYADSIGYRIEPLNLEAEIMAKAARAERLAAESGELSAQVQELMRKSGRKLEDVL